MSVCVNDYTGVIRCSSVLLGVDTLKKVYVCIKDTFQHRVAIRGTFSIMDKMIHPNASFV